MVKKRNMTLLPIGGLANRMRAIASAVHLCRMSGCSLDVYWFRDKGLNACFGDIFKEIKTDRVCIHGDSLSGKLLYDHPRRHNMWIPRVPQKLLFRNRVYDNEINDYERNKDIFMKFLAEGGLYVSSCYPIIDFNTDIFRDLFKPVEEIETKAYSVISNMSDYRIGIHVRRTDHIVSINNSPNELFYQAIDEELNLNNSLSIYLATDSENVKEDFKNKYGNRIFFSTSEADRNSVSGIMDAVAQMYVLSMTNKIYGSYGSSYSEVAAALGGIPLIVLKND